MRRRVIRHQLPRWFEPDVVFSQLYSHSARAFWLDSGVSARSGFSYLGESSRAVTTSLAPDHLGWDPPDAEAPKAANIFEFLADAQAEGNDADTAHEGDAVHGGGFQLGWVGWFGYELRAVTMGESQAAGVARSRYPDAAWLEVLRAVEFDHAAQTVTLLALSEDTEWGGESAHWRDSVVASMATLAAGPSSGAGPDTGPDGEGLARSHTAVPADGVQPRVKWRHSDAEYLAMVRECQAAIANGDAYQLCLTTEAAVDIRPDPLTTYLALRAASPSHHGGYLRMGEYALLSSSPEIFLTVSAEGVIESRPIKGTRRRGQSPQEDLALRAELEASEKERAENLMIVDLMRNDIARVSEVGSVTVPSLIAVESYAQVHQLVSTVRGHLSHELRPMDAVVACFPAGSMTGAPKSSATAILDRLEGHPRGIYSGAFGYFGLDGRVELAMVIRSIVLDGAGATIGAGGGITALSVPEDELDEVKLKAAALLRVLGASGS